MRAELRDWDLWGPLFICMSLAVMLSIKAHHEASLVFSVIFVIVWVGAAVITVNGQLLGGRLSFFQSVCLLGYCVFPVLLSAIACWCFNEFVNSDLSVVLRFASVVVAMLWSLWGAFEKYSYLPPFPILTRYAASSSFMTDAKFPQGRKLLALYPVFLFYLSLSWMVLIGFQRQITPPSAVAQAHAPAAHNPGIPGPGKKVRFI